MSAQPSAPLHISIVGKNIFSALFLLHQKDKNFSFTVHSAESLLNSSKEPRWIAFPFHASNDLSEFMSLKTFDDPFIFYQAHRRYRTSDFLAKGPAEMHPAIRQKTLSIALWNDFTPHVWIKRGRHGLEPHSQWPNEISLSFKEHLRPRLCLLEKNLFQAELEKKLSSDRIKFLSGEQNVLAVHVAKKHEKFKLVHNAPFEPLEADRILWTSPLKALNEEAHSKKRKLKPLHKGSFASWETSGAWVDSLSVGALPEFSIWIDDQNHFFTTALPSDSMLRRVIAIPYKDKTWLQVQTLKMRHSAAFLGSLAEVAPSRPDQFLWKICPQLKSEDLGWHKLPAFDEDEILESPLGLHHLYHSHCQFWSPSFLQSFKEQSDRVIASLA